MANKTLKQKISDLSQKLNFEFISPPVSLCTDNGAMIAALGYEYFKANKFRDYEKVISSKTGFL
jgi:tRNA A37 threonylcarbamoyltransferase TsaD